MVRAADGPLQPGEAAFLTVLYDGTMLKESYEQGRVADPMWITERCLVSVDDGWLQIGSDIEPEPFTPQQARQIMEYIHVWLNSLEP